MVAPLGVLRPLVAAAGLVVLLAPGCAPPTGILELELELPPTPQAVDIGACAADGCEDGATCEQGRCIYRGEWFSRTEVAPDVDFSIDGELTDWSIQTDENRLGEIPLGDGRDRWSCSSLIGSGSIERLSVRVYFCRSTPCNGRTEGLIEQLLTVERPIYDGRRTVVRRRLAPFDAERRRGCTQDADCDGIEGPRCLEAAGPFDAPLCGCRTDEDCPRGFCTGAGGATAHCVENFERCNVAGCRGDDELTPDRPSNFCEPDATGPHFCETESATAVDFPPVNCFDG